MRNEILGQIVGKTKWAERDPLEIHQWLESRGLRPVVPQS